MTTPNPPWIYEDYSECCGTCDSTVAHHECNICYTSNTSVVCRPKPDGNVNECARCVDGRIILDDNNCAGDCAYCGSNDGVDLTIICVPETLIVENAEESVIMNLIVGNVACHIEIDPVTGCHIIEDLPCRECGNPRNSGPNNPCDPELEDPCCNSFVSDNNPHSPTWTMGCEDPSLYALAPNLASMGTPPTPPLSPGSAVTSTSTSSCSCRH